MYLINYIVIYKKKIIMDEYFEEDNQDGFFLWLSSMPESLNCYEILYVEDYNLIEDNFESAISSR